MARYPFRIVNVFADSVLSGNALAVFEDAADLSDEQMQALALQFNLSETTFLFPSSVATAKVRIFSPSFEMPFAGHPTLGTAHVVRAVSGSNSERPDALTLEMKAGIIPVTAHGNTWTLRANAPRTRVPEGSREETALMLGLDEAEVNDGALWVDTGSEQLVIPLVSPEAVRRCQPDARLLARYGSNASREGLAYVWAREDDNRIVARFFFLKHGALIEDPGTGSACANLGGWFLATKTLALPFALSIRQGELTGRRCQLGLRVDLDQQIFVTGKVVEVGHGEMVL